MLAPAVSIAPAMRSALLRIEFRFAAKRDAELPDPQDACLGARHDQAALELTQSGQYRQE